MEQKMAGGCSFIVYDYMNTTSNTQSEPIKSNRIGCNLQ